VKLDKILRRLSADPRNAVFVMIEGDSARTLGWLYSTGVGLVSEHGSLLKWPRALVTRMQHTTQSADSHSGGTGSDAGFELRPSGQRLHSSDLALARFRLSGSASPADGMEHVLSAPNLAEQNEALSDGALLENSTPESTNVDAEETAVVESRACSSRIDSSEVLSTNSHSSRDFSQAATKVTLPFAQSSALETAWQYIGFSEEQLVFDALPHAVAILEQFEELTPGSLLTVRRTSATWYYSNADPEFAFQQAADAKHQLEEALTGSPLEVSLASGNALYVRPRGVNKGTCVEYILERLFASGLVPDFVAAFGDDRTDEQMFSTVETFRTARGLSALSCTVGRKSSNAQYTVDSVESVINTLQYLVADSRSVPAL